MEFKLPKYDPNKVTELFQSLGYSLWMIQSLELALGNYLIFAHKISIDSAVIQVQQIFNQTSKKTFGSLLKELKENDEFLSEVIMTKLENVLKDRNWLVHKVYAVNNSDMYSESKAISLLTKIRKIGEISIELSKLITQKTDEVISQKGFMTIEELDKRTQNILNSWVKER